MYVDAQRRPVIEEKCGVVGEEVPCEQSVQRELDGKNLSTRQLHRSCGPPAHSNAKDQENASTTSISTGAWYRQLVLRNDGHPCQLLDHHPTTQILRGNSPATRRRTTPPLSDQAISPSQPLHHSWNPRDPNERSSPPDFPRQSHARVGPTILPPITEQNPHLTDQIRGRQTEQCPNPRILQWRNAQPTTLQNRRQPPRNSRAESTLRIKKQPSPRVPPLPIRKFRSQRNHDDAPLLCDLCALLSVLFCVKNSFFFVENFQLSTARPGPRSVGCL